MAENFCYWCLPYAYSTSSTSFLTPSWSTMSTWPTGFDRSQNISCLWYPSATLFIILHSLSFKILLICLWHLFLLMKIITWKDKNVINMISFYRLVSSLWFYIKCFVCWCYFCCIDGFGINHAMIRFRIKTIIYFWYFKKSVQVIFIVVVVASFK